MNRDPWVTRDQRSEINVLEFLRGIFFSYERDDELPSPKKKDCFCDDIEINTEDPKSLSKIHFLA